MLDLIPDKHMSLLMAFIGCLHHIAFLQKSQASREIKPRSQPKSVWHEA
jgi:hypothetical protein